MCSWLLVSFRIKANWIVNNDQSLELHRITVHLELASTEYIGFFRMISLEYLWNSDSSAEICDHCEKYDYALNYYQFIHIHYAA